jgi:hypothetical protein
MEVVLTENIRHWIRTVLLTSDLPSEIRDELRKYSGGTRRTSASASPTDDGKRPRTIPFQLIRSVYDMQLVKGGSGELVVKFISYLRNYKALHLLCCMHCLVFDIAGIRFICHVVD